MTRFNLSSWALRHATLMFFLMVASMAVGAWAFITMGRAEDPSFTMKIMVVSARWPGATTEEMSRQVLQPMEEVLQEVPWFDFSRGYARPEEATLFVFVKDFTPPTEVKEVWYQVRKRLADARQLLPPDMLGPFYNDEFGDTFGNIYSFSGDGFSPAELKDALQAVRLRLLRVPDVAKVQLLGVQDQRMHVEVSHARLAELGIPPEAIFAALRGQNEITAAGVVEGPNQRLAVRVSGALDSADAVAALPVRVGQRTFRLGDLAAVSRSYVDPPEFSVRHEGEPVLALAVSMVERGDILKLGDGLEAEMALIRNELPHGIEVRRVADQPDVVRHSVDEFIFHFALAVGIVLAVSFISLGWRTGIVVALSVPLVLAITFGLMRGMGIDLHRISLGALIIALGLLVDDAIIAVEMMKVKLEEGFDREDAASFAWTATAFPMLSGTLVTAAGFIPVGFAQSSSGEYTGEIFWVVGIALVVSWLVAVMFTPLLGHRLLPAPRVVADGETHDPYDSPGYRRFGGFVTGCLRHRWLVAIATLAAFAASIVAFGFVQQQFFPNASRVELVVDLDLHPGASYEATLAQVERLERILDAEPLVSDYVAYVGGGAPRFFLATNPELRRPNFAQFVIMTRQVPDTQALFLKLRTLLDRDFADMRARVARLENGPPVGYPVQFRVLGDDIDTVRTIADQVRAVMRANPYTRDVNFDWSATSKAVKIEIDQDRARALGVSTQAVSDALRTVLSGAPVTVYREDDERIPVVVRAVASERLSAGGIPDITVRSDSGRAIPVEQIGRVSWGFEEALVWRRDRMPAITVRADISAGMQAPTVSGQVDAALADLRAGLPTGYRIDQGGMVEESSKGAASITAVMPAMLVVMLTILMIQLESFRRVVLVFITAPLGLIGVTLALLATNSAFGFVAQLGVIALAGMIMRNAVILVDQIDRDRAEGKPGWVAIRDATVRRTRPIVLTAAAAILALIPLTLSAFWGPMAIAIMGGLLVATVLTLVVLPALYGLFFGIKGPPRGTPAPALTGAAA